MKLVLFDDPIFRPYTAEQEAAARAGVALQLVTYDRFRDTPQAVDVVLNAGCHSFPADLLAQVRGLRCIVGYCVGVDWINLDEASARGILVVNMPHVNLEDVATHALGLIIACSRRLPALERLAREGDFDWGSRRAARRLSGMRLGLLAYGNIARTLARLGRPIFRAVAAHDPFVSGETMRAHGVEPMSLDALLRSSDVLSVHVPKSPTTTNLLNSDRLALLPPGAILVVTSRGSVYDADAVAQALGDGRLSAAGLDVFPQEPLPPDHPLLRAPNTILTPHAAGHSEESIRDRHTAAVAAIQALANDETPAGAVNADHLHAVVGRTNA